ncbi:hypothetical protein K227x_61840 [Rubripirellula lacrimiformis]|uniref:DUF790 family protein n=1 Tax=Rubripirellula lacrimiformis TaxID=1930273 RepID=A0A517NKV2_9BACT|nr:DUF790 family protein [Rubripirellula lacrimiformis]QDT07756.1 hypothetical protein K227x_61840 [Rubripirellula lacrimiformis]
MLRSEHSIVTYDFATMTVQPDRLRRRRDDAYVDTVNDCITAYREGIGRRRQDLHSDVGRRLQQIQGCPPRRIASFCKLLDDCSQYRSNPQAAVALRRRLFQAAAPLHPIVSHREGIFEHDLLAARQKVCAELGIDWNQIESNLFADVIELQTLESIDHSVNAASLLSQYNITQTQAALYRASSVRVEAFADFKSIIRHAKLARLMHRIDRIESPRRGYRFVFDGPGSALRSTSRYGIGFAKLMATLLRCSDWKLGAAIIGPQGRKFRLTVTPADRLGCPPNPEHEFDSQLESDVEAVWKKRPVAGWTLEHESELLHRGQTVLTPDFVLRHDDGRLIYLEVVGFWTPEYLAEKVNRLRIFIGDESDHRWLLLFPKSKVKSAETMSEQLQVPFAIFDKRSDPADWVTE